MKLANFNTALICLVVTLSTVLLIGYRLGATWAGGDGFLEQQTAVLIGPGQFDWSRGETISSFDHQTPMEIKFGESKFWLDERTEVKLLDARAEHLTIDVLHGRIVAQGPITISTRELKTTIVTPTSFVHYSWLNKIEVAIIDGLAYEQSTLPPYSQTSTLFNPATSSASAFYEQVLTKIQTIEKAAE